jgi:hypothetical protein
MKKTLPNFCDQCGTALSIEKCTAKCPVCTPGFYQYTLKETVPVERKVEMFDKIFDMCERHFNAVVQPMPDGPRCDIECDCPQYVYEEAMQGCLGEGVFRYLNQRR